MKINTLNFKHRDYCEKHEIYVGTQTGAIKRINTATENPYKEINLNNKSILSKDSCITCLNYKDCDASEILIGRADKNIEILSTNSASIRNVWRAEDGPIVGLVEYDNKLIAGLGTGKIQIGEKSTIVITGNHMSRMRQCIIEKKLIASGGKDRPNNLKIFDLSADGKEIFKSKNLPNDKLQLEIPVWDNDFRFIDSNIIATCSRYGYLRLYDIRKQRRPVMKFSSEDNQMKFCSMAANGNLLYTGTTMGNVKGFDTRLFKNFIHTYKGFTGSVSDLNLDPSGKFLLSASLDRYVRVHHTESCTMLLQSYVKSKATRAIIKEYTENIIDNEESNEVEPQKKKLKKSQTTSDSKIDNEYEELFQNLETIW